MAHFFSKTTGGFYSSDIHLSMPEDVVEISAAEYKMLINGQSAGKRIVASASGMPALTDKPLKIELTKDQARERIVRAAQDISTREARLNLFLSMDEACSDPVYGPFYVELRTVIRAAMMNMFDKIVDKTDTDFVRITQSQIDMAVSAMKTTWNSQKNPVVQPPEQQPAEEPEHPVFQQEEQPAESEVKDVNNG
jgi:hypothetical protein